MKLMLILLLLLWDNVDKLHFLIECSQLPSVERAFVPDEYKKVQYQTGDVIYFSCDPGYTTGFNTTYKCTEEGWRAAHYGQCVIKPCVLPDDIPNGYYEIIKGEDFVFGTTIQYVCNEGYQMVSKEDTRTCLINDWSNHLPVCERKYEDKTLVCGKDGKWNNPFPNCVNGSHVTKGDYVFMGSRYVAQSRFNPGSCGSPPPLVNGDFIASTTQFEHNTRVDYQCQSKYVMQGEPYKTCLNGVWTGEITCLKPCTINPDLMIPNKIKFQYKKDNNNSRQQWGMRRKCVDGVMILPRCV
uniref:Sushi domain-containing protein n=1 Tax=Neogobius melanostomus TaxID=47308 RepID=A0A8C6UWV0_9GOBI